MSAIWGSKKSRFPGPINPLPSAQVMNLQASKIITYRDVLTINAPLILKMRDIYFFLRANYIMGHFKGYFEGAKTFLTPKIVPSCEISREMAHYVVCPKQKKIMSLIFKINGALVFLCTGATICPKNFLFIVDNPFLMF